MTDRTKLLLAFAYLLGALVTYGHAWSHVKPLGTTASDTALDRFLLTACAAAVWPSYVSVTIFEKEKQ